MDAIFVELPPFERNRAQYLDDEAFRALQSMLMRRPEAGDVIQGTGGLRKVRFADERRHKGKRGGIRVIYCAWLGGAQFWLFTLCGKDVQDDLSAAQKKYAQGIVGIRVERKDPIMKRDVFSELVEGFDALAEQRSGKATLRSHKVRLGDVAAVSAAELVALREELNMSRPLFAMHLRTNARTLENWEQGRAKPNAQAMTLIRLVQKFPETVEHLAALT